LTTEVSEIQFTDFELDVLRMIVGNMSTSEIAFALDVEQSVVIEASENIFTKLGASDAKSATEIAAELKLVKLKL
jgi:DNA-binding NarL/FixJ family response regulator